MRYDAGMGVELLTKRHKDQIVGVLSCYDRILIQGTVPGWCYARGMTDYFYKHQLRIFDYPKWAEPLRQQLRQNLERIAAENALPIEFVRSRKSFRKEDRVKQILEKRGEHPGVVCILSAMEPCGSYKPWHGTTSQATKPISSRTMASAFIITSTSWTTIWGSARCGCRRGVLSGCSSIATATAIWHDR